MFSCLYDNDQDQTKIKLLRPNIAIYSHNKVNNDKDNHNKDDHNEDFYKTDSNNKVNHNNYKIETIKNYIVSFFLGGDFSTFWYWCFYTLTSGGGNSPV